jgi:hypothetical protein
LSHADMTFPVFSSCLMALPHTRRPILRGTHRIRRNPVRLR